ncbi:MAG TPA: NAD-dependent epimerase/dehydratase family protein [Solirubrobacterales bacterium]|nr:NAD-dependent epimerase/dehydratase family protein [Solirubrobacterales bacterium]
MALAIVTGSGGLVGSDSVRRLVESGWEVIGLENDMRARFFGSDASTAHVTEELVRSYPEFKGIDADIRDGDAVLRIFEENASRLELVIHAAAQPSHDWAAREPHTDFGVNAVGTLNLLEATRATKPGATFVFMSTNKVYGDTPNSLPLEDRGSRLELPEGHRYFGGIDTSMSIDRSPIPSSACPRPPPTSWSRSTGAISICRPCASAAAASPAPPTPARGCMASSPT